MTEHFCEIPKKGRGKCPVSPEGSVMNLREGIAMVAYELFGSGGCIHGCNLDDRPEAGEKMVLGKHAGREIEEPEDVDISDEAAAIELEKIEALDQATVVPAEFLQNADFLIISQSPGIQSELL